MYEAQVKHWRFLESTYYGGRDWFSSNIFKYFKEGTDEFSSRIKRAYRFNHTREVVDLVNKYLFRAKPVRREDAPQPVQDFWKKSTISGLGINELMRSASIKSSIFGRPWMIVDSSVVQEEDPAVKRSIKDDKENAGRIYAYVVSPVNVLDMSYDEGGELNWILIREEYRQDDDPFESDGFVGERFRLWTRTEWFLISNVSTKSKNLKFVSQVHNLGMVPAIPLDNQICDDRYESPALIADIGYLDRACANYASNLDAIIQDQTFSQLAIPAQGLLPSGNGDEDSEDDDIHKQMLEVGTKRVFTYDGDGGGAPMFLSPDPRQAQLIIEAIQQIINEIYHSVGLAGERTKADNSKGIDNSSGVAKGKDFERVNALLASKADSLELAENRLVTLVCRWAGIDEPKENLVSYSEDFDIRELNDEFYIAMQLSLIDTPHEIRKEHMKKVVEKLFPHIKDQERQKMISEINNWEFVREVESDSTESNVKSKVGEEAKRDRDQSAGKQADTKKRTSSSKNSTLTE
jgi:hypothetical protein